MTKFFNKASDREKRKYLRKNMTEAEQVLWEAIRKKRLAGYRFRRQYSIKGFVVDFYLPSLKLAVELDGGYHIKENTIAYDKARQYLLESMGITFLRFNNDEIMDEKIKTVDRILEEIRKLKKIGVTG